MSDFACTVERVRIEPHPNADKIELARVGDFVSIVQKGQYRDGDLAVYIPEGAVVPDYMLKHMGLWDEVKEKGKLSGPAGNRVKAIKLRGVLSQGLVWPTGVSIPCDDNLRPTGGEWTHYITSSPTQVDPVGAMVPVKEGDNVAVHLGIMKYEPPLPANFAGRIAGVDFEATFGYDFENIKKNPSLFDDGEPVVMTEKIHGTLMQVGIVPSAMSKEKYYRGRVIVTSKGLGKNGYILDPTDESNIYVQAATQYALLEKMMRFADLVDERNAPFWILGEVFGRTPGGKDVQDLTYGQTDLKFRMFDAVWGPRSTPNFLEWMSLQSLAIALGVDLVPPLYVGAFSRAELEKHTNGTETVSGVGAHMREGVVVKSLFEKRHPRYGRKIAKSVSEAYLLRKNENATEFA